MNKYFLFIFLFFMYKVLKFVFFRKSFNHNCVVITGGAGALGVRLAKLFLKKNTKVILIDNDQKKLDDIKQQLPRVITIQCDICKYEELKKTINTLLNSYKIDTLINNAGIVTKKSILDITKNQIDLTFKVNAIAPIYLTKLLLPFMITEKRGHIINISSVAGLVGINRLSDYCSSKSALIGFNNSLRTEVEPYKNIHTTCICPYFFRSNLFKNSKGYPWPLNYIMYVYSTEEIAGLIYRDINTLKEFVIYPKIFGYLLRIRYIFPKFIQDQFIKLGSNID